MWESHKDVFRLSRIAPDEQPSTASASCKLNNIPANAMRIREANSDDIPVLSRLIRDSFRDVAERFGLSPENAPRHPSNCTEEWVENDLSRGVTYFILEENGEPQGCVALEKAAPDLCYLERLAVLPQSRRKGLGRALVEHVFGAARALGAGQVGIGIIAAQTELKLWYEKLGFEEVETKTFAHLPFLVTFMTCVL